MKKSYLMAGILTGAIVLWMVPGLFSGRGNKDGDLHIDKPLMSVETHTQASEAVTSVISVQGSVLPNREVVLRAETHGTVKEILIQEGASVREGDVILRLDMDDRGIRLERAQARVTEAKRKYDAAAALGKKGFAAQSRVDEALALLKDAEAEERQIRLEIEDTEIRAPFDGILGKRGVEIGDYVSVPDEIISVVDNTPLVVAVPIPQHEIGFVKVGGHALINRTDGTQAMGRIRFVAPRADSVTRTFRADIEIPNPDGLASGTSANVLIPKPSVQAHGISPGILTLDEAGLTGVKVVDEEDKVQFFPVKIVSAKPAKIFVTGLPDQARIIVGGQGFVRQGEKVKPVEATGQSALTQNSGLVDSPEEAEGVSEKKAPEEGAAP